LSGMNFQPQLWTTGEPSCYMANYLWQGCSSS
jgi:hypothetical protein